MMNLNFFSFKNTDVCMLYLVRDNIKILVWYNTNRIINDLFQTVLTTPLRGSNLVFTGIEKAHYKFHKISPNRGGPYIGSSTWVKKGARMNSRNKDKCS